MAQQADSPGALTRDNKLSAEVNSTSRDVEQPLATTGEEEEGEEEEEDYPVERVEAVYKKLDLRIIPGLIDHAQHFKVFPRFLTTAKQPSGSSTSCAAPSAPTSASPRP